MKRALGSISRRKNLASVRDGRPLRISKLPVRCHDSRLVCGGSISAKLSTSLPSGWMESRQSPFLVRCTPSNICVQDIGPRFFSSDVSPESSSDNTATSAASPSSNHRSSVLQQTTTHLLQVPVGSFDDQQWSETHYTILGWLEPSEDKNFVAHGLARCWLLLDRLVQEEAMLQERSEKAEDTSTGSSMSLPTFFRTDLLNLVANHWRKSVLDLNLNVSKNDANKDLHPPQLLQRLYRYQESSTHLCPDFQTFAMILDAISSMVSVSSSVSANRNFHGTKHDGEDELMAAVDDIMKRLVNRAKEMDPSDDVPSSLRPNVVVFSSAMNAWAKSGRTEAPVKVEELLQQMKMLHHQHPSWKDMRPNQVTYSTAIDTWAKSGNVEKVQELMQEMHQASQENEDDSMKPATMAFTGYLKALSKQGRMEEAEATLLQMEALYEAGELDEAPNVMSYSTVLDGYARSTDPGASMQAESLLQRMLEKHRDGKSAVTPNAVSFNSVILAHVNSGNIHAAESLVQRMHEEYVRSGNKDVRPTLETYSTILSGLAKSRQRDAGERAENILDNVKELSRSGELDQALDVILYNAVLDCWAKSRRPESPDRSKNILSMMIRDGFKPDIISFNTVVHCMAKSGRLQEAESLLKDMEEFGVRPNAVTFNTLLSAYVSAVSSVPKKKKGSEQEKAMLTDQIEHLFERLKQVSSVSLDVVTYNTVLHFYSRVGEVEKASSLLQEMLAPESRVTPDLISMNTVISAWANSGREDAPERAEAIFEQVLLQNDHRHQIAPTSVTFNAVMSAWTKSRRPEAAERCEQLFDLMKTDGDADVQPDFVTFNILIHAWSLSTDEAAPDHAERAFAEMKRRYQQEDANLRPNNRTLGALINVWSKSNRENAGEMAESYLRTIIRHAEQYQDVREVPRVHEFTGDIRAWANSGDPRAPYKADAILYLLLQQIEQGNKHAQPDNRLFGAFLSTLASSGIPNKGVHANKVVQMMIRFNIRPNDFLLELLRKCQGADRLQNAVSRKEMSQTPSLE